MKKLLLMIMIFTAFGFGIAEARSIDLEATFDTTIQIDRDYHFDLFGLSNLEMELESQTYLVGCEIGIGNLSITPKIGVSNSEMEIEDLVTLENSVGLAAGLSAEYMIYEPMKDLKISLIGDYLYSDSEIDTIKIGNVSIDMPLKNDINRHDLEGGVKAVYSGLPLNGDISLGLVYSRSEINAGASLGMLDIDLDMDDDGLGLRPGLSFKPIEGLEIGLGGKLIDQKSIAISAKYVF